MFMNHNHYIIFYFILSPEAGLPADLGQDGQGVIRDLRILLLAPSIQSTYDFFTSLP